MVLFLPFRALHIDRERISLEDFVAEPYDVITPHEYYRLIDHSPHTVMHLDIPTFIRNDDFETALAATRHRWELWSQERIFCRAPEPAFYWYRRIYRDPGGNIRQLMGLIGLIRISSQGYTEILPHEAIHPEQVKMRMQYYRSVGLQTTPVFFLDSTPPDEGLMNELKESIQKTMPYLHLERRDGQTDTVWMITDENLIQGIQHFYQYVDILVIGDGHHRFEALRKLSMFHPDTPEYRYILGFVVNIESTDVLTLGYHRVFTFSKKPNCDALLTCLQKKFEIESTWSIDDTALTYKEYEISQAGPRLILLDHQTRKGYRLHLRPEAYHDLDDPYESIDTYLIDRHLIDHCLHDEIGLTADSYKLEYQPFIPTCLERVRSGSAHLAVLVDPLPMPTLFNLVKKGKILPPKSTYFYPKLPAGLVMYPMDLTTPSLHACSPPPKTAD